MKGIVAVILTLLLAGCGAAEKKEGKELPVIGFLDFVEDETLAQAKKGFFDALEKKGYSETTGTLRVLYRNAQGDQPTLIQACDYLISEKVDLLATNTTLSTITAVQRTREIPVCMMVAPRPDLAKLTDSKGQAPANLFGVFETLEYIDTSMMMIREILPQVRRIGTIYNQSEPQSVDAFSRIQKMASTLGLELVALPVNNSSETQLVTQTLLTKGIDAFFALPDNVIFASFETVAKACKDSKVPVFTSEAGLVKRGALAAFGADLYQWGYQAGEQAAAFLASSDRTGFVPQSVTLRRKVYNPATASWFGIKPGNGFTAIAP
jgi:putative tryptophan/tyrosine transport system substrate-binding protein